MQIGPLTYIDADELTAARLRRQGLVERGDRVLVPADPAAAQRLRGDLLGRPAPDVTIDTLPSRRGGPCRA